LANDSINQHLSQVYVIPFQRDSLLKLAQILITDYCDSLPDLSHVIVILPDMSQAARCREHLLIQAKQYDCHALLGPNITTLQAWANSTSITKQPIISDYASQLQLVEALLGHPDLYGQGSPWLLAKSLLELFNQLSRNLVKLPDSLEQFTKNLAKAYGINNQNIDSLSKEAHIVYSLWHAMQEQLKSQKLLDRETAYSLGLHQLCQSLSTDKAMYLAGFNSFTRAEYDWINTVADTHLLKIILHGYETDPVTSEVDTAESTTSMSLFTQELLADIALPIHYDNSAGPFSEGIDYIYSWQKGTFIERSKEFLRRFTHSPIQDHIEIYLASSAENEAQAIDLQIRMWCLDGISNIAIVTENRKLARRVRAILERSDIHISDSAGWALSTTSASTMIERLLQVIEEDFHYQALLDLLKSPFIFPDMDRQQRLETVYRFERGIVENENIASGMQRYLDSIAHTKNKLPPAMATYYDNIPVLLESIDKAVQKLKTLLKGKHPPAAFIAFLMETLESLGIEKSLATDDAGYQVITELNLMSAACKYTDLVIDWLSFRIWLGETMESYNFQPTDNNSPVQLLNLAQSSLHNFDAVIIAGMEKEYLPGYHSNSPFFNDEVRASLGLGTQRQHQLLRFYQFRQLLESGTSQPNSKQHKKILLTARKQEGDEEILASPWLEAMQSMHTQTYGHSLDANTLDTLLKSGETELIASSSEPLPEKLDSACVVIDKNLIPKSISASGYQQLLNCPYQFYAARCLQLSPPENVQKFLAKSDYGERVH